MKAIGVLLFITVVPAFHFIARRSGFITSSGTRYRDRLLFSLLFTTLLSISVLFMYQPGLEDIWKGAILGILLAAPEIVGEKVSLRRRIQDNFIYSRNASPLMMIVVAIVFAIAFYYAVFLAKYQLVLVAVVTFLFLSHVGMLVLTSRYERQIGARLLEMRCPTKKNCKGYQ